MFEGFNFIEQFSLNNKLRAPTDKPLKVSEILQGMTLLTREKPEAHDKNPQEMTDQVKGRQNRPTVEEIHLQKVLKEVAEGQERLMATVVELNEASKKGVSPPNSMNRVAVDQRSLMKSVADLQHAYKNFTNPEPTVPRDLMDDLMGLPNLRLPWKEQMKVEEESRPPPDVSFLDNYMEKMEDNLESLKLKMDEFEKQKKSFEKKPTTKNRSESFSECSRSRSRGRASKHKRKRRTIYLDRSASSGTICSRSRSSKREKNATKKHRKNSRECRNRGRSRKSKHATKAKTSRRKSSNGSSDDSYVIKRQGRRCKNDKKGSRDENLEEIINELLKKSKSCCKHLEGGGKLKIHLDGYPPIILNGDNYDDDDDDGGNSSAKTLDDGYLC